MSIINTGRFFLTNDDFIKIQLQPFNIGIGHFDKRAGFFFHQYNIDWLQRLTNFKIDV